MESIMDIEVPNVLDPIVDVSTSWFKAHMTFRVFNFIFYVLMVLEILGLELYSNLARKKILIPWRKAALLTFYLCVIAQAVVRIVLTFHKDLGAKYVLNRYIPVLLSFTISTLLVLHWLNKIKKQVYRLWQMLFIVLGYAGFFTVVWLQVNYAIKGQTAVTVDKFYAVIFSLLNMVLVIVCIFIWVSYRKRFARLTRGTSVVAKYTYFVGCWLWVALIAVRVFIFDILAYYVFDVLHSESLVFANEVLPIFIAIAVRKGGDLLLHRDNYETMRDAGMPGFVAMVDDGRSKPYQVTGFDALSTKVGTLLLYDDLIGEGRNSKVHEASLFETSTLGLEDQESNYGAKVAVKLFHKVLNGSTRETEVIRKLGKEKAFLKYKGFLQGPDNRLGFVMARCETNLPNLLRTYGITYLDTLDFAQQIAQALLCLHQNRIIHRNLKITNVLAKRKTEDGEDRWRLLLSDFDPHKQPEQTPIPENANQAYLKSYLPPEMLRKKIYGYSGDFWAYGWVVLEMSNTCGFSTFALNHLIIRCRLQDPDARINFETIIHKLEKMKDRQGVETRKEKPLAKHMIEDSCDQLDKQYTKNKKQDKKERMMLEKQKQKERGRDNKKRDRSGHGGDRDRAGSRSSAMFSSRGSVRGSDDEYSYAEDLSDQESEAGSEWEDDDRDSRRGSRARGGSNRDSPASLAGGKKEKEKRTKKGKKSHAKEEEWERERERIRQKNKPGLLPISPGRSVKEMGTKLTKLIDI